MQGMVSSRSQIPNFIDRQRFVFLPTNNSMIYAVWWRI